MEKELLVARLLMIVVLITFSAIFCFCQRVQNVSWHVWLGIAFFGLALDALSTFYFLQSGQGIEGNPIMRNIFLVVGVKNGIFLSVLVIAMFLTLLGFTLGKRSWFARFIIAAVGIQSLFCGIWNIAS